MAEWKDQQAELLTQAAYESGYDKAKREMKVYLERKLVDIRKENSCGPYGVGYNQGKQRIVNEIINELLGGE